MVYSYEIDFFPQGDKFVHALEKTFPERKGYSSRYSDIYDGEIYQNMYKKGFLKEMNNISLTLNTDGIPVFRSSGYSFWPQFLLINELPYKMRYSYIAKYLTTYTAILYIYSYIAIL